MNAIELAENGHLPYWLLRFGIRQRVGKKLSIESSRTQEERSAFLEKLRSSRIAEDTDKANEQHYEVPADFYKLTLGPNLKYSCSYWPRDCPDLATAEEAALKQIESRAQLGEKQNVLDLGCGWGSFSLWASKRYPDSRFTAVSNSYSQGAYIREQAEKRGIENLEVVTCDINQFEPGMVFDRIISVEMLEHARNYESLFERISSWMHDDAKMFVHVFSHRRFAYDYDASNPKEWMAREFFTGGIMPSHDLLPSFDDHLTKLDSWYLDGTHYQKTSEAWLENMNANESEIKHLFDAVYGPRESKRWMWRWRLFFLACSELFGYKDGTEWGVSHYLLGKRVG